MYEHIHKKGVPNISELGRLPLWALIVFGAKCARLCLGEFRKNWPDAPLEYDDMLEAAISYGEYFPGDDPKSSINKLGDIIHEANVLRKTDFLKAGKAQAVAFAADYLAHAIRCAIKRNKQVAIRNILDTALFAAEACEKNAAAIRELYNEINRVSAEHGWTDQSTEPFDYFYPSHTAWRRATVFISSTFSDMHSERDHLMHYVFPRLQARLEPYKINLNPVDLRWGVTVDQVQNNEALEICITNIHNCRPFFIGIIGQRYGRVPAFVPDVKLQGYEWLSGYKNRSITELEFRAGGLETPADNPYALFMIRDNHSLEGLATARLPEAISVEEETLNLLKQLRESLSRLPAENKNVHTYTARLKGYRPDLYAARLALQENDYQLLAACPENGIVSPEKYSSLEPATRTIVDRHSTICLEQLEEFGKIVEDHLWKSIHAYFGLKELPAGERPYHFYSRTREHTARQKTRRQELLNHYVRRSRHEEELAAYLHHGGGSILFAHGQPGCGKSAMLAAFGAGAAKEFLVLEHYADACPEAAQCTFMLAGLCVQLQSRLGKELSLDYDKPGLVATFKNLLYQLPPTQPVLFIIDGIDLLAAEDREFNFSWLPPFLPAHISIVLSGRNKMEAYGQYAGACKEIQLGNLDAAEREALLEGLQNIFAKNLDAGQKKLLLEKESTGNPLFLVTAMNELAGYGIYTGLPQRIALLPQEANAISALFHQVLDRMEAQFDARLVAQALSLLYCSRRGLSLTELNEMLTGLSTPLLSSLFPFLQSLRYYIGFGDPLLNIKVEELEQVVKNRYLPGSSNVQDTHACLARFFQSLLPGNGENIKNRQLRGYSETGYHLAMSGNYNEWARVLSDIGMIEQQLVHSGIFALLEEYRVIAQLPAEAQQFLEKKGLLLIANALRQSAHILATHPGQLYAQLTGRLTGFTQQYEAVNTLLSAIRNDHAKPCLLLHSPSLGQHSGASLLRTIRVRHHRLNCIGLSNDGSRLVTGDMSHLPQVWDVATGLESDMFRQQDLRKGKKVKKYHRDDHVIYESIPSEHLQMDTSAVAFSPDDRWIVSGSNTGELFIWDSFSIEPASLIFEDWNYNKRIMKIAFLPGGKEFVSIGFNGMIMIWDFEQRRLLHKIETGLGCLNDMVIIPNSRQAIIAAQNGTVTIWDLDSREMLQVFHGHGDVVWGVDLSPGGEWIASCSRDKTIKLWNRHNGSLVHTFHGHKEVVRAVKFSYDGKKLFSGDRNNEVFTWCPESKKKLAVISGHSSWIQGIEQPKNSQLLITASDEGEAKIWDTENSDRDLPQQPFHKNIINSIAVTADGKIALTASSDKTIKAWDTGGYEILRTIPAHADWILASAISPCGQYGYSGGGGLFFPDYYFKKWDLFTGREVFSKREHNNEIRCIALAQDGTLAFTGSLDGNLNVWDSHSGQLIKKLSAGNKGILSVAASARGNIAVTGHEDGRIVIWDVEKGTPLRQVEKNKKTIFSLALSADARRLLSGCGDHTVSLWDVETGGELATYKGHTGQVMGVDFPPGEQLAVSVSYDRVMKIWELGTQKCIAEFVAESDWRSCRALSDHRFLAGEKNGSLHLLQLNGYAQTASSGNSDPGPDTEHQKRVGKIRQQQKSGIGLTSTICRGRTQNAPALIKSVDVNYIDGSVMGISAADDGILSLWDVHSAQWVISVKCGPQITALKALKSDSLVAVAVNEGTGFPVQFLSLDTTSHRSTPAFVLHEQNNHAGRVWSIAETGKGHFLTASSDCSVHLWSVRGRETVTKYRLLQYSFINVVIAAAHAGFALCGGGDMDIFMWEIESGETIAQLKGHTAAVTGLALAREDSLLVSCGWDGLVITWDMATRKAIKVLTGRRQPVTGVAVTPDGRFFLSVGYDGFAQLWSLDNYELVSSLEYPYGLQCCAAIDNDRFIVGDVEGNVYIVNMD